MVITDPWDTLCRLTYDDLYYAPCLNCSALFGSLVPALCNRTSFAQVYELPQSHCGDNREGTLFSWLFSHIYIYINYFPSVLIYVLPFINHIKIALKAQSSTQTKLKTLYYTKFFIAPVNVFHLVREMAECTIEILSYILFI